jgi:HYR domain-containing protein
MQMSNERAHKTNRNPNRTPSTARRLALLVMAALLIGLGLSVRPMRMAAVSAAVGAYKFAHPLYAAAQAKKLPPAPAPPSKKPGSPHSNLTVFTVMPATTPTAIDNDYLRIKIAVEAAMSGDTIMLSGTFDWTEPFAAASWALGNDGVVSTTDDYSILVPPGLNTVTFTAASLGAATIQGPGDLAAVNLEGVLVFDGGDNQGWTISNIRFLDFDLSIGFFNGAGGADAFNNTTITNNYIRIAQDLNATVAPADVNQNIGIHFSFGTNQTISGNMIDFTGDGVSDSAMGNFSSQVGMQSNTSGGSVYDGLQITNNILQVLNAQSADPENILGIWENGHAHTSNITVSGNQFINLAAGNNPATNLQRGFRVTSHSSAMTMVTYQNNTVQGANIGFQWISGSNFAGNLPVKLISNTITNNATGVLVQSQGLANLSFNRIVGNSAAGINNVDGMVTAENNWWGCNFGPGVGGTGCAGTPNGVTGVSVDSNPWLVLRLTAMPGTIFVGGMSTLTADLTFNSDNVDTSLLGTVPNGIPVQFSGNAFGHVSPTNTSTTSGKATSTYTGTAPGTADVSTLVDAQTVTTPITVSPVPAPVITSAGSTIVAESCSTPVNGAVDPGETVTVSLCVQNTGNANTTNLVGTLQATGGVTSPSGPQNYGVVVAGGPPVCRNFTFTAVGTCGGTITATLQLQDGATNLGSLTYTFTLGVMGVCCTPPTPVIAAAGATLVAESCSTPANGAVDPGETVTVSLCVQNTGTGNTTNLVGTLQATGGVTSPSGPQNYGVVVAGGPPVCRNFTFTAVGTCGGTITATLQLQDGATNLGTVTYTFTLGVGGVCCPAACMLTCPNPITKSTDPNQCSAVTNYPAPMTTGACGTVTCVPPSGSAFQKGTTTVTCTSSTGPSCSFTITVNDTQPPTITCPTIPTKSNDPNQCGAVVTFPAPVVSDNCPGVGTPGCSPASGSFFPKGTTTVTCTVADSSGNTAACTSTVTVNDTQPPSITCGPNLTAKTPTINDPCAVVTFPNPVATDNCPGVTAACTPASGSCFPVGTTTVSCTATDMSSNTATCSFTVTVFNVCLQDDSVPATVFLGNTLTGDYRFCCGGTIFTGKALVIRRGSEVTFQHNPADRRVQATDDEAVFRGTASIQFPAGTIKCTITDRNTRDNSCICQ